VAQQSLRLVEAPSSSGFWKATTGPMDCDSWRCAISTLGRHRGARRGSPPESHLIPNVLAAALGRRSHVSVFGQYYPTPDGTAVRDYIHVADLGSAHMLALDYLRDGGVSECINLGNGKGYSVAGGDRGVAPRLRPAPSRPARNRRAPATPRIWSPAPTRPDGCWAGNRRVRISKTSSAAPGTGAWRTRRV